MGVESCLVLWVSTADECCHPDRFRVELMLIESFEIGRLDFSKRDTLKSTHCFFLTRHEMSDSECFASLLQRMVRHWRYQYRSLPQFMTAFGTMVRREEPLLRL